MTDDLASSVATSATKQQVEQLVVASVSELGSSLRSEIISDIDSRFNSLSTNKRPGSSVDLITGTFLKSPNN